MMRIFLIVVFIFFNSATNSQEIDSLPKYDDDSLYVRDSVLRITNLNPYFTFSAWNPGVLRQFNVYIGAGIAAKITVPVFNIADNPRRFCKRVAICVVVSVQAF